MSVSSFEGVEAVPPLRTDNRGGCIRGAIFSRFAVLLVCPRQYSSTNLAIHCVVTGYPAAAAAAAFREMFGIVRLLFLQNGPTTLSAGGVRRSRVDRNNFGTQQDSRAVHYSYRC